MKVCICKTFDFDAAHRLGLLPPDHKCHRLHGHTYRVDVVLAGEARPPLAMFIDYADIARAWAPLHDALDHRCLNDVAGLGHPTTEALAEWILRKLCADSEVGPFLVAVRVHESSSTWCEARTVDLP